jgi:hypothetical protein
MSMTDLFKIKSMASLTVDGGISIKIVNILAMSFVDYAL